jgi:hypothetical protein
MPLLPASVSTLELTNSSSLVARPVDIYSQYPNCRLVTPGDRLLVISRASMRPGDCNLPPPNFTFLTAKPLGLKGFPTIGPLYPELFPTQSTLLRAISFPVTPTPAKHKRPWLPLYQDCISGLGHGDTKRDRLDNSVATVRRVYDI